LLKESLGLKTVEPRLEKVLEQAAKQEPGYAEFLDELLCCEVDALIEFRLAGLAAGKTPASNPDAAALLTCRKYPSAGFTCQVVFMLMDSLGRLACLRVRRRDAILFTWVSSSFELFLLNETQIVLM
jgi:hypothetical protein